VPGPVGSGPAARNGRRGPAGRRRCSSFHRLRRRRGPVFSGLKSGPWPRSSREQPLPTCRRVFGFLLEQHCRSGFLSQYKNLVPIASSIRTGRQTPRHLLVVFRRGFEGRLSDGRPGLRRTVRAAVGPRGNIYSFRLRLTQAVPISCSSRALEPTTQTLDPAAPDGVLRPPNAAFLEAVASGRYRAPPQNDLTPCGPSIGPPLVCSRSRRGLARARGRYESTLASQRLPSRDGWHCGALNMVLTGHVL